MKVGDYIFNKGGNYILILGNIINNPFGHFNIKVLKSENNLWDNKIVSFSIEYIRRYYRTITKEEAMLELL